MKLFATIRSAYSFSGDGLADLPYPIVALFHKLSYERVCGYSLGHSVDFFSTLKEAQASSGWYWQGEMAIVELELNDNEVVGFSKLHTVEGYRTVFKKFYLSDEYIDAEPVKIPLWEERAISAYDLSTNALVEINRQYRAHLAPTQTILVEKTPAPSITKIATDAVNKVVDTTLDYIVGVVESSPNYFPKELPNYWSSNTPNTLFSNSPKCAPNESPVCHLQTGSSVATLGSLDGSC